MLFSIRLVSPLPKRRKSSACDVRHYQTLINGKADLTAEMALRIHKAFGPDVDHLLRMQVAYDVAKIRKRAKDIKVKRYVGNAA